MFLIALAFICYVAAIDIAISDSWAQRYGYRGSIIPSSAWVVLGTIFVLAKVYFTYGL